MYNETLISLEELTPDQRQKFLQHYGHPYAPQSLDNSKDGRSVKEMDNFLKISEAGSLHLHTEDISKTSGKPVLSTAEMPSGQTEYPLMTGSKPSRKFHKVWNESRRKVGGQQLSYSRFCKAVQGSPI